MKRLVLPLVMLAALIASAAALAYPSGGDGPLGRGSCGYWNTWAAADIGLYGGVIIVCYPDGYWHKQFAGHDYGIYAD